MCELMYVCVCVYVNLCAFRKKHLLTSCHVTSPVGKKEEWDSAPASRSDGLAVVRNCRLCFTFPGTPGLCFFHEAVRMVWEPLRGKERGQWARLPSMKSRVIPCVSILQMRGLRLREVEICWPEIIQFLGARRVSTLVPREVGWAQDYRVLGGMV